MTNSMSLFYKLIVMFFLIGLIGLNLAQPTRAALDVNNLLNLKGAGGLEDKLKDKQVIVSPGNAEQTASGLVSQIFSLTIKVAGAVFMILILIGGFMYLISAGNEESSGKAKRLFLDAVVGLAIVLAAWALGAWVLKILT